MRTTKKHNEDLCHMNYLPLPETYELPLPEVKGEQEKESGRENKRRKVVAPQIFAGFRDKLRFYGICSLKIIVPLAFCHQCVYPSFF